MTLYLARHGRSLGKGLFLGQSDPELSDQGRRQSVALAERLAGAGIVSISCSALRRSMETATIIGRQLGLPVQSDSAWNELAYGCWDGLSWNEIERAWPDEARRKLADWWAVTPEGGEAPDAFLRRVHRALDGLRTQPGPVLLVGHAGVNGLVSELLRGGSAVDWGRVTRFEQDYGSVVRLETQ